jgi:hypothetical protein
MPHAKSSSKQSNFHNFMSIVFFIVIILFISAWVLFRKKEHSLFRKRKQFEYRRRCQSKPFWVKRELIRIKAHIPNAGCRQVADIFNRRFKAEKEMSVGKTYVHVFLREHIAEVLKIRKRWKHRIPQKMARNSIWGMDMTGVTDNKLKNKSLFGIIDHGSRKCLSLHALKDKASITLIRKLLDVIEEFGKPKAVRTDNEPVFTSRLFRFALWVLGIRHQRTMLHCPWQNGRVERFFGTFKAYADRVVFNVKHLQESLNEFVLWYNAIRPHRNLGGRTPDEVWNEVNPYAQAPKSCKKFSAWGGLLKGYWLDYG